MTVLDEVVRQCNAGEMTTKQLQYSICGLAKFLKNGPTTTKQRSFSLFSNASEDIKKMEALIENKVNGIGRRIDILEKTIKIIDDKQELQDSRRVEADLKVKDTTYK